jgi:hypothetical protein
MRRSWFRVVGVLAALCPTALSAREEAQPSTPALVTTAMPFTGITPCRIVDTRNAGMPLGYGPPALPPGNPGRSFVLANQCGIPSGAQAVSLNVTVVGPQGPGYILLYPQGGAQPLVSTLNYLQGQTVANAATVPLGTGGGITVVAAVSGTELVIDTNGYFGASPNNPNNVFLGLGTGNPSLAPFSDTGLGYGALASDSGNSAGTAVGYAALTHNSATSSFPYSGNAAAGSRALFSSTTGLDNTAVGSLALNQGQEGFVNYAAGYQALRQAVNGYDEVAVGSLALSNLTTDPNPNYNSSNAALGYNAGANLVSGRGGIYIGHPGGNANEDFIQRIGLIIHQQAYLAGVRGAMIGPTVLPVLVDGLGKLGTEFSSARFKEDIQDMSDSSSGLARLRPVTFRYKDQSRLQYGLIAEEVERILPELVTCGRDGEPETVSYQELPAMLLNEFQKQDRRLERDEGGDRSRRDRLDAADIETREDQRRLDELLARIEGLEVRPGSDTASPTATAP